METFDNTSPIFEIFVYYDQDVSDVDYLNSLQLIINQFPSCDLSKSEFQKSIIATFHCFFTRKQAKEIFFWFMNYFNGMTLTVDGWGANYDIPGLETIIEDWYKEECQDIRN